MSSQLVNAETTWAKLVEFEFERQRLLKLKEDAANSATNATTNFRRLSFRKKVCLALHFSISDCKVGPNLKFIGFCKW